MVRDNERMRMEAKTFTVHCGATERDILESRKENRLLKRYLEVKRGYKRERETHLAREWSGTVRKGTNGVVWRSMDRVAWGSLCHGHPLLIYTQGE